MTLAIGWLHDGGDTVETWLHQAGDWHATANSAAMSAAAGSPAPNKADELVEFASPRSDLAPRLHTNADSRNSYAHGAADHVPSHPNAPSATAPEQATVTRPLDVPTSSHETRRSQRRARSRIRTVPPPVLPSGRRGRSEAPRATRQSTPSTHTFSAPVTAWPPRNSKLAYNLRHSSAITCRNQRWAGSCSTCSCQT